ncbi:DUF4123 domain-containing protein [Pseudomonas sp. N3-W]|uniref:DUF4123 domain-containing protein n=1 Tax=Pseudomonas sp. N3-W TaxID=2975049 RepID=UPI00217D881B|nr:DUF4123 domain-containing protein [Pseudomonas sp. N3-W]UWF51373.1 DUF4123 domain-containing protein [Pseudomonas sp. N3-W]
MQPDSLTPHAWLTERPLQAGERLYLIISAASDAQAIKTLHETHPAPQLTPLWSETPYASWEAVMPYLAEIKSNSDFLPWITATDARDWGWLAVSTSSPEVVLEHLRSLTQVRMPNTSEVFFRFWDGRFIHPILEQLGDSAGEILPVFNRYLINGQCLDVGPRAVPKAKDWPWWEVPQELLDSLTTQNPAPLIDNLLQWLEDEHPQIYNTCPESNLKLKVTHFVRRPTVEKNRHEALLNYLILEQG